MLHVSLDVGDTPARVALVPGTVELFRRDPELDDKIAGEVLWLGLSPLLAPSSLPMMILASEPPMNAWRFVGVRHLFDVIGSSILNNGICPAQSIGIIRSYQYHTILA
jgi:hypothetical protein